jgi:hypothetical protein
MPKTKGCDDCLDRDARYHEASKKTKATLRPYSHSWKLKGIKDATEDELEKIVAVASQVHERSGFMKGGRLIWHQ